MLIQKLLIDEKQSYRTNSSLEGLVESLLTICKKIPIITVYSSKVVGDISEDLDSKGYSILTLTQYKENKDLFDCSHLVFMEYSLLSEFGYDIDGITKPFIVMEEHSEFPLLILGKFNVDAKKDYKLIGIYTLSKMYNNITVVTKFKRRIDMFMRIFKINGVVYENIEDIGENEECLVLFDGNNFDASAKRIFLFGKKHSGYEKIDLKLDRNGKHKYRILDLGRRLSKNTVENEHTFDYSEFDYISNGI